jgi:hypothetical protein
MAVFPSDGDVSRINRGDLATVRSVAIEANASADL